MSDVCRDFWIRVTGTDQQVAQLHDRYMMMMMMMMILIFISTWNFFQVSTGKYDLMEVANSRTCMLVNIKLLL
jgi:hypothetical protein